MSPLSNCTGGSRSQTQRARALRVWRLSKSYRKGLNHNGWTSIAQLFDGRRPSGWKLKPIWECHDACKFAWGEVAERFIVELQDIVASTGTMHSGYNRFARTVKLIGSMTLVASSLSCMLCVIVSIVWRAERVNGLANGGDLGRGSRGCIVCASTNE